MKYSVIILFLFFVFVGCKDEVLPKPKAMLRLDFPNANYNQSVTKNFVFDLNQTAILKRQNDNGYTIDYPLMKGSIYLTYKSVNTNLETLLTDAQKLSYEHAVKADNIVEQPFINEDKKVYGMFYEITGNAASQSQFYATDSLNHFVTGSLYFYARPNYDSILPAAVYLQNDIRKIMESLEWKN
ncbi:gliding motility lipoprotein GldD [Croceitalea rosinachiae]|uniref:Gliding motility lipoprotein GldD n=1 Tax=Croceitalea rosinachiae TaxID=3075596 RepID=A0ABU3A8R5_9FLAO|nr:gliding motility lipoprotein GldD [Croceitalea sp. F388]MDT0606582.1 gliding motility lipoprotein GldD [Croceitalea sp. F388]